MPGRSCEEGATKPLGCLRGVPARPLRPLPNLSFRGVSHSRCNVGYAFINFISTADILPFYEEFNFKKWDRFNSDKVCEITYARIQGKVSLITHFEVLARPLPFTLPSFSRNPGFCPWPLPLWPLSLAPIPAPLSLRLPLQPLPLALP